MKTSQSAIRAAANGLLINESVSYSYVVPKDPDTMIIDLYLWILYYQYLDNLDHFSNPSIPESSKMDIEIIIEEALRKSLKSVREYILMEGMLCVASELLYATNDEEGFLDTVAQNNNQLIKKLKPFISSENPTQYALKTWGGNKSKYIEFMRIAGLAFEKMDWPELYGGEAWVTITDELVKLLMKSSPSDPVKKQVRDIDHIIDIAHNTDRMIELSAIDAKAHFTLGELLTLSSIPKRIASMINRALGLRKEVDRRVDRSHEVDMERLTQVRDGYAKQNAEYAKKIASEEKLKLDPDQAWKYGMKTGKWSEVEDILAQDARTALLYSGKTGEKRFPKGEAAISKDAYSALDYAILLKRPWPVDSEAYWNIYYGTGCYDDMPYCDNEDEKSFTKEQYEKYVLGGKKMEKPKWAKSPWSK